MNYISFLTHKKTNSIIADESWIDGNKISFMWKINLIVALYFELNSICTDVNAITWDSKLEAEFLIDFFYPEDWHNLSVMSC